jgi:Sigma-70, region 4
MEVADELVRLAYLLGASRPPAEADLAAVVHGWLADPRPDPVVEPDPLADPETEQLRRGLTALTPRQRAAVVLRHWSGLPVAEVAGLLDCPEETVELETGAALDVLATDEERLAANLAALAGQAPIAEPGPVRRRWRSAGVALAALVVAGGFAAGLGDEADAPAADPGPSVAPTVAPNVARTFEPVPEVADPAPSFDNRSRRLTAQLAAAHPTVLPARTMLGPATVSGPAGDVVWAPLVFHVTDTPDIYFAMATLGAGRDAAVLKLDVGYRRPDTEPSFVLCPRFQKVCTARQFPDGTSAAVAVFSEAVSDQTINRLTILRPDGTFCHVAVFYRDRRPDPPPLDADDLFRFATVFTF